MSDKTFELTVGGFRLTLPALEPGPDYVPMRGDVLAYPTSGFNPEWRIFQFDWDGKVSLDKLWVGAHIIHRAPRLREVPFTLPTGQRAVLIGEDRDIEEGEEYFFMLGPSVNASLERAPCAKPRHDATGSRVPKAGARIRVVD